MSDESSLPRLVKIASDTHLLQAAQAAAAARLLSYDGETYPHDGCAVTLSVLLQQAGVDVTNTSQAIALGRVLEGRGWTKVPLGEQQQGDVGSTCGPEPHHGTDHIYLVLKVDNSDEMVIADNQSSAPHFRYVSGKGHTPTQFFLRASA